MKAKGRVAVACACVLAVVVAVSILVLLGMKGRANPSPSGAPQVGFGLSATADGVGALFSGGVRDDAGFPEIDWERWRLANPDVVGWVTVSGTPVNYPIVQASAADPEYYLTHDVYGERNFYGCPYLDADCAEGGLLESWNAVVLGHNMSLVDGSLFTTFSRYSDEAFAGEHSEILLQTPERKLRLQVIGVRVVNGAIAEKRVSFSGEVDFQSYCEQQLEACDVRLVSDAVSEARSGDDAARCAFSSRLFTFVTCSYTRFDNERTLVFAVSG